VSLAPDHTYITPDYKANCPASLKFSVSLSSIQTVRIEMHHRVELCLLGGLEFVMLIKQLASDSELS